MATNNPWHNLPPDGLVLPEDEPDLLDFNQRLGPGHKHFLDLDHWVPEAFVGRRDAPVILLSNNPGIGKSKDERAKSDFAAKMRRNLRHEPTEYPFVFLDPGFTGKWWRSKLKEVIRHFDGDEQLVARNILNVLYFPYPSVRFRRPPRPIPSQAYNFSLVEEAANRDDTVIVFMRHRLIPDWYDAVPRLRELPKDRLCRVNNPQMPSISPRNCTLFDRIVEAIELAERKRNHSASV
jgi:hypothetical protein